MGGVGAEVAKNIILGGVKSVTLLDADDVSELDNVCQFLAPRESIGQNVWRRIITNRRAKSMFKI